MSTATDQATLGSANPRGRQQAIADAHEAIVCAQARTGGGSESTAFPALD